MSALQHITLAAAQIVAYGCIAYFAVSLARRVATARDFARSVPRALGGLFASFRADAFYALRFRFLRESKSRFFVSF